MKIFADYYSVSWLLFSTLSRIGFGGIVLSGFVFLYLQNVYCQYFVIIQYMEIFLQRQAKALLYDSYIVHIQLKKMLSTEQHTSYALVYEDN